MGQQIVSATLLDKSFDTFGKTMTISRSPKSFHQVIVDFVSTDNAALASHMYRCTDKRSRFFNLHAAFELARSVVFSHVVTTCVFVGIVLAVVDIV